MFTIPLIALGALLYLTVGRTVSEINLRIWRKGDPSTPGAKFFLPIYADAFPEKFGVDDEGPVGIERALVKYAFSEGNQNVYHLFTSFLWPIKLAISLCATVIKGTVWLANVPRRLIFRSPVAQAALSETSAESDPPPPERLYLDADSRERELWAELEKVTCAKNAAAKLMGGEAEARKLLALPGKT